MHFFLFAVFLISIIMAMLCDFDRAKQFVKFDTFIVYRMIESRLSISIWNRVAECGVVRLEFNRPI